MERRRQRRIAPHFFRCREQIRWPSLPPAVQPSGGTDGRTEQKKKEKERQAISRSLLAIFVFGASRWTRRTDVSAREHLFVSLIKDGAN